MRVHVRLRLLLAGRPHHAEKPNFGAIRYVSPRPLAMARAGQTAWALGAGWPCTPTNPRWPMLYAVAIVCVTTRFTARWCEPQGDTGVLVETSADALHTFWIAIAAEDAAGPEHAIFVGPSQIFTSEVKSTTSLPLPMYHGATRSTIHCGCTLIPIRTEHNKSP